MIKVYLGENEKSNLVEKTLKKYNVEYEENKVKENIEPKLVVKDGEIYNWFTLIIDYLNKKFGKKKEVLNNVKEKENNEEMNEVEKGDYIEEKENEE